MKAEYAFNLRNSEEKKLKMPLIYFNLEYLTQNFASWDT